VERKGKEETVAGRLLFASNANCGGHEAYDGHRQ
jgi:hypothetical protein